MPTARGWIVAALGLLIAICGNLFGAQTLIQLGYALIVLVFIAIVVVRLGNQELAVKRAVSPERARLGEKVTAKIRIENYGRRRTPLLLAEDRLPEGLSGRPRFAIQGMEREGWRETAYALTPSRRSRYEIGPLTISVVDPFGLARVAIESDATSTFLVHPRFTRLITPRDPLDRRVISTAAARNPAVTRGEEFYTLREYVEGDDLRRIHWPSTAKRGRYMIRQEETPWQTRATILLDDFGGAHDASGDYSSFETMIEGAASLVDMYHRIGFSYRLAASLDPGVASGRGSEQRNRCLDRLAVLTASPSSDPDPAATKLLELDASATGPEAALMISAGSLTPAAATALVRAARRFRQVGLVCFPAHRYGANSTKSRWAAEAQLKEVFRLLINSNIRCTALGPDDDLAVGWAAMWQAKKPSMEAQWVQRPEPV